ALFGEKYGDIVRVIIIDRGYSVELCGGTHVGSTGELGIFKITHEAAVAAGVRRIEAVCGYQAEQHINEQFKIVHKISESLKNPKDLLRAINDLSNDHVELQKLKNQIEKLQANATIDRLVQKKQVINSVQFYHDIILNIDAGVLKRIYSELEIKDNDERVVALLIGKEGGKVNVLLGCSENFKNFDSNKIIKEQVAPLIKGGGGGQKFLAVASGTDSGNLDNIIAKIKEMLNKPL
ncbi:MAG: DHHA1 domain-containing protein, partial [Bacteroidota bacterium]|nr:DHHA1 domain-containing protein [Bacteroidota bacterium]